MKKLLTSVLILSLAIFISACPKKDAKDADAKGGAEAGAEAAAAGTIDDFGKAMCKAGMSGDADAMVDLMMHPKALEAMEEAMKKMAEAFGGEEMNIREEMKKEFADKKLETCEVTGSEEKECEEASVAGYDKMGLKAEKCGSLKIKAKPEGDDEDEDSVPVVKIDGKWYMDMGSQMGEMPDMEDMPDMEGMEDMGDTESE